MSLRLPPIASLIAASLPLSGAFAQPSDVAVKAAFLPKFAAYVSWPASAQPSPGAPWRICTVGANVIHGLLQRAVSGQLVDGHPFVVMRMAGQQATSCNIAFISGRTATETAAQVRALSSKPILTVTDQEAGAAQGMINFVVTGGNVRFDVDVGLARRAGLTLSSRLLAVALTVRGRDEQ